MEEAFPVRFKYWNPKCHLKDVYSFPLFDILREFFRQLHPHFRLQQVSGHCATYERQQLQQQVDKSRMTVSGESSE
jgi:hypothetical protein